MLIFERDIAIDMGTNDVLLFVRGKGVQVREPTIVAVDKYTGKLLKVGREAQKMLGPHAGQHRARSTPSPTASSRGLRHDRGHAARAHRARDQLQPLQAARAAHRPPGASAAWRSAR